MTELQCLTEFLGAQLPESALTQALTFAAVTASLVGLLRRIPWIDARRQVAGPVLALVIGQVFGWWSVGFDPAEWPLAVGTGLVVALVAIGGYSGAKNVVQSTRR
ncbi:hypothetical protein J2Z79_002428 [Symbiobacterium terraclitae]|uniref:Holin n=1 Tax=Symbiobacterium terraclitae TaxID=557451 RepID=A0ABS4JTZ4_9FIRM|nr:hypothetical protein [Symbiobacterium terraclitae]MBP2019012.1 hypothetical protein [Symbiobacterium terraclitae]